MGWIGVDRMGYEDKLVLIRGLMGWVGVNGVDWC